MAEDQTQLIRVDRLVAAGSAVIFDILANPARHAELAGSDQVLGAADAGPSRLCLGARFGMRMRQVGPAYTSVNEVVEFEDGRRIAWQTWGEIRGRPVIGGQIWRFILTPQNGSTHVRHEYDWGRAKSPWVLNLLGYPKRSERHMRETLDRLEPLSRRADQPSDPA